MRASRLPKQRSFHRLQVPEGFTDREHRILSSSSAGRVNIVYQVAVLTLKDRTEKDLRRKHGLPLLPAQGPARPPACP
jgi:hypothetical protein